MAIPGNDVGQRLKHKAAMLHTGMGHYEVGAVDDLVVIEDDVDIHGAGGVAVTETHAAEFGFDIEGGVEHGFGIEVGIHQQCHIQEILVGLEAPGLGLVDLGHLGDAADAGVDLRTGLFQQGHPVALVASDEENSVM